MFFALVFTPITSAQAAEPRQNDYPIVLVHGLAGFDNVLGIPYWGFCYDISKDLKARGYENYVTAVGPFSSNWDRACELYAQIVGGTVDYGISHSEKYGHERFGRTYPGLYPEWGEINPETGGINKIHLIGHSMGGQTIRTLATLLVEGSAEERAVTPESELSPLFQGDKEWLSGVLSVATPHDGSSAGYALVGNRQNDSWLQTMLLMLGSIGGTSCLEIYDFHFDQWGLVKKPREKHRDFIKRVESSQAWQAGLDFASWDLRPEGAMELNQWVTAQPDFYYFSQAASCTYKSLLTGHHLPRIQMSPFLYAFASHIGSYTKKGPIVIDKSWWENDGLVSVITADGPHLGSTDEIIPYNGTPEKGKWNYLGQIDNVDHIGIVGILSLKDPRPLFRSYAELLGSLPE
ncbi:MAG: lipase [Clostridium sp.]|nr:lipase [Clostridium sp.]